MRRLKIHGVIFRQDPDPDGYGAIPADRRFRINGPLPETSAMSIHADIDIMIASENVAQGYGIALAFFDFFYDPYDKFTNMVAVNPIQFKE
jgi:hypothetical protein